MDTKRVIELLSIEMTCVMRASGLKYDPDEQDWVDTGYYCNRDCAHCDLVQDSKEILDMYREANRIIQLYEMRNEP